MVQGTALRRFRPCRPRLLTPVSSRLPVWKVYKEGQGKWARVLLVTAIALTAVFLVVSIHDSLPARERLPIPLLNWCFDYRFLFEGPILIAALVFGVWLFNHPPA